MATLQSRRVRGRLTPVLVGLCAAMTLLTGCNDAQSGALLGAGIGALAGYVIGNESDKSSHLHYGHGRHHDDYEY